MMDRPLGNTDYRLPTMPSPEAKNLVDKNTLRSDVPCGSCTLCCRTLIVPLAEEEYHLFDGHWAWVTTPEGQPLTTPDGKKLRALQRRPNGDCVFLGERGCTIH